MRLPAFSCVLLLLAACAPRQPASAGRQQADAAGDDLPDAPAAPVRRDGGASDARATPAADAATPSTRLRTRHVYFGDKAVDLVGIYDTVLDDWCDFVDAADGQLRCMPERSPTDILYLDAACTQPAATNPPGPGGAAYASIARRKPCGLEMYDTYRRLAPSEVLPTFVREIDECKPNPAGMVAVHRMEKITDQMVVGTRVRGDARDGIAPVFVHAEGRAVRQQQWYDTTLDVPCWAVPLGPNDFSAGTDKVFRCLPRDTDVVSVDFYFSDSTCQRHAASTVFECGPGHVGELYVGNGNRCPTLYRYFKLGAPVSQVYLPQGSARTCQVLPSGPDTAREVLGEIAPETLPRAELTIAPGPERIRAGQVTTAAGSTSAYYLWDETLKAFCYRTATTDGHERCIPVGGSFRDEHRFGDAACTRPLAATPVKRCLPMTFAYQLEGTTSNRVARVFPDPVLHQGPVFTNVGGACAAAPMKHPKGYPEYDLGPEIRLDQLAELRIAEP